jgi:uncharacterized radical SAM superfamily Fe-S cluster-containing enzyme
VSGGCGAGCGGVGDPIFLSLSRGVCRVCRRPVEVRYVADQGGVFLERFCPEHGTSRALVAETLAWYLAALQAPSAARPPARTIPRTGECCTSCGPCSFHAQACHLPVFSITNACDLRCPICFTYNRPDRAWFMSPEELDRHLDFVLASTGGVDLVNVTGGEPTMHPRLPELLRRCRRPGIGRVTVNTNGLRIARDPDLAKALADAGAYAILSLDTLDRARSVRIHGRDLVDEKRAALDALERAGVQTTLLMVLAGGVNEDELPALLDLLATRDHVRSLTVQTMAYTGQGGATFEPRRHVPVEGVERRIEEATAGRIARADFVPLPTAHPLCYGVTYLLAGGDAALHPLTRLLRPETLSRQLGEGYLLRPGDGFEAELREGVDRLWASGADPAVLATVKELVRAIYPPGQPLDVHERQRRAERRVKTIYVHAHMDEDTFEVGRAMRCPDQVPVHAERLVGACAYNLFHRQRDERFWVQDG